MFKMFLKLNWKEFNRGNSISTKLVAKIFKWFWIIYFAFMSVMIGIIASAYGGPTMEFPLEEDSAIPFLYVNKQMIYFFAYLIVMRYFIQTLPFLNIKSFLLTPLLIFRSLRISPLHLKFYHPLSHSSLPVRNAVPRLSPGLSHLA